MHDSSYEKMDAFVRVHLAAHRGHALEILDFGSQVVGDQGLSYKGLFDDPQWNYRGLDIEAGDNVDIKVANAYDWSEVPSDSVDLVISGQAFEHVEYFWASMFEIVRALKPGGIAAIIAPSGGFEHRYPVDCWRFYRDGFSALAEYVGCDLVDAFTDWGNLDWEDSILVARKPLWNADTHERFHRRSLLQRSLLDDGPLDLSVIETQWTPTSGELAPSILADLTPGALTTELDAARNTRLEANAANAAADTEASAAQVAALEQAAADAAELEVHRAHAEALRVAGGPAKQLYGTARARVAAVVGGPGRALYKRLRGRS